MPHAGGLRRQRPCTATDPPLIWLDVANVILDKIGDRARLALKEVPLQHGCRRVHRRTAPRAPQ